MRTNKFRIDLQRTLSRLDEEGQGPDVLQSDPIARQQAQNAESLGKNKSNAETPNQQQLQDKQKLTDQNKQKEDQNKAQSLQLQQQIAKIDQEVVKIQGRLTGASSKPQDVDRLNQLLNSKKSLQDRIVRLSNQQPGQAATSP